MFLEMRFGLVVVIKVLGEMIGVGAPTRNLTSELLDLSACKCQLVGSNRNAQHGGAGS
jgi:hypothetical protein